MFFFRTYVIIARYIVKLSIIVVSYFMVKKYYFTFKLVLHAFSGTKYENHQRLLISASYIVLKSCQALKNAEAVTSSTPVKEIANT